MIDKTDMYIKKCKKLNSVKKEKCVECIGVSPVYIFAYPLGSNNPSCEKFTSDFDNTDAKPPGVIPNRKFDKFSILSKIPYFISNRWDCVESELFPDDTLSITLNDS